jgi:hypothetical protein
VHYPDQPLLLQRLDFSLTALFNLARVLCLGHVGPEGGISYILTKENDPGFQSPQKKKGPFGSGAGQRGHGYACIPAGF